MLKKLWNSLVCVIEFIKIKNILKKVYRTEGIREKFSKIFNIEFKKDWVSRLYGIITPQDFPDNMIYGFNTSSISPWEHIVKMISDRLLACDVVMQDSSILDLLSFEVKELDRNRNIYLLIFKPYNYDEFIYYIKYIWSSIKKLLIYVILISLLVWLGIVIF